MADNVETEQTTVGERFIDTFDPDDPKEVKEKLRPTNIKADMKDMEKNKRVSLILNSQAFREELEAIIETQLKSGPHPASLIALQQIADLVLPHSRFNQTSLAGGRGGGGISGNLCAIPVADIRGVDSVNYSKGEKMLRCKLGSLYRLADLHGWTQLIYNHISVRSSAENDHFLINPFGLMYHEITASSLVKVDTLGNIIDPGTTTYGPNLAGFTLHAAIHNSRPDMKCVLHVHTPAAAAVSTMKCGLLPISQESLIVGDVSYYDYRGILIDDEQKDEIIRALGPHNKVLFLRNHGIVCMGETIEEAYHYAYNVIQACEIQVKSLVCGLDNIILVSDEIKEKVQKVVSKGSGGVSTGMGRKWKVGELEFEAMMRQLDNMGHRTGYCYHQPLVRSEPKPKSDVAIPPSSSSVTYVYDDDIEGSKYQSPLKLANRKEAREKTRWLNTPNTYTKVEVAEEGTENQDGDPKTKTQWVHEDDDQTAGQGVKVEATQFNMPNAGEDPKEYKKKQKELKADRRDDKITSGPISEVLSGVQYGDARRKQDDQAKDGGVPVQAASKGIIQRDYAKDSVLYTAYSPNPFEKMTEKEILEYKREIAEKTGQDVKEIELIVQQPDAELNGDGEGDNRDSVIIRETKTIKGEDGKEITTTKVVTTIKSKETTFNGDAEDKDADQEKEENDGEKDADEADEEGDELGEGEVGSAGASPTKEAQSPTKKKKKFRTPSFLKKKKERKTES